MIYQVATVSTTNKRQNDTNPQSSILVFNIDIAVSIYMSHALIHIVILVILIDSHTREFLLNHLPDTNGSSLDCDLLYTSVKALNLMPTQHFGLCTPFFTQTLWFPRQICLRQVEFLFKIVTMRRL